MAPRKIYISGTSGTGKTTLAKYLSMRYRIPFVSSSAKEIWEQYGVKNHQELIAMTMKDPKLGLKFQNHLIEHRLEKLEGLDQYVTDRGPLDNLVYFMSQCSSQLSEEDTMNYIQACRDAYPLGFTQIYLTNNPLEMEVDGYRIDNRYYQTMVDVLYMHYTQVNTLFEPTEGVSPLYILPDWDWEKRVKAVETIFNKNPNNKLWQKIKERLGL